MIRVRFTRQHGVYNAGEVAAFDPHVAERLLAGGAAVLPDPADGADPVDAAEPTVDFGGGRAPRRAAAAAALPEGGADTPEGGAADTPEGGAAALPEGGAA